MTYQVDTVDIRLNYHVFVLLTFLIVNRTFYLDIQKSICYNKYSNGKAVQ